MGYFPLLADDDVHQWLLEEALMERLEMLEAKEKERLAREAAVAAAERAVADRLAQGRRMRLQ